MKKTLSIILSATVLLSVLCFSAYAQDIPDEYYNIRFVELDKDGKVTDILKLERGTPVEPDPDDIKAAAIELLNLDIISDLYFYSNTTRAEFAKMACMFMGYTDDYTAKDSFSDVPKSHWAYSYISFLKEQGLIQGTSENTFEPDEDILLCDALKIITQNLNIDFYAERYSYPEGYVKAAQWGQLLTDAPEPETTVSRGEMFKIIQKAIHTPYMLEYTNEQGNLVRFHKTDGDGNNITPYTKYFKNNS